MRDDAELFVQVCMTCGRAKQPRAYLKAPLQHIIAHDFNEVISIDHIIPELEGRTPRNNRYILSVTDVFTGFIVAVPCRTKESLETIRILMHHWALVYGYPKEILADNDKSFTSDCFNAILSAFNIKATHGTPYKCSSTSKAERSNKRINNALRLTLNEHQLRDWDLYLKYVTFALNCLRSRHTGFSANMLVYAKELNTPLNLVVDNEPVNLDPKNKYSAKAYALHRTIKTIVRKARKHAALDFKYADNYYNKNLQGPYFEENQWCFVLINCPKHKFSARWRGPYKICKVISEHLYIVEMEDGKEQLVNISKLKPYKMSKYAPKCVNSTATPEVPTSPVEVQDSPSPVNDNETTEDSPISLELEVMPQPITAHDVTAPSTSDQGPDNVRIPTTQEPDNDPGDTWFDAPEETLIIAPPDTLPNHQLELRRSTRTKLPVARYQAGF